jgi:hypothetical protein
MSHYANLLHLLGRLKNKIGDSDEYDEDEPEELRYRPSRWSASPEPEGQHRSEWSESPERVNTPILFGAPDTEIPLMQLLEREFPRENVPNMVRIRWKLKTMYDLYNTLEDEIDKMTWLDADEKKVLRRLCGID